jgi:hypothetical protein
VRGGNIDGNKGVGMKTSFVMLPQPAALSEIGFGVVEAGPLAAAAEGAARFCASREIDWPPGHNHPCS